MSLNAPLTGNLKDLSGFKDLDATQLPSLGLTQHPSELTSPPPIGSFRLPVSDIDNLWLGSSIHLDNLKTSAVFVRELKQASFVNPPCRLSYKALECLHNPSCKQPSSSIDKDT